MKKELLFILFILFGIKALSQNLECSDFKNGSFIGETEAPLIILTKIKRRGNTQTEIAFEKPKEFENTDIPDKMLVKLNWIDDCSYVLTFNTAKTKLTASQKFINDNGGVLVEKIKIEGTCFYYTSRLNNNDKEPIVMKGKICKE